MSRAEPPIDPSLVPLVRQEERRLAEALRETREQAQSLVAEAQRRAEARVDEARRRIPEVINEARTERIEELEQQTRDLAAANERRLAALETAAGAHRDAAVAFLVAQVLAEGPA